MTKYSDELKYKVMSRLYNEDSPSDIAHDTEDVPLATIIRWKKDLNTAIADGGMTTLVDLDRVILGKVIEGVQDDPGMKEAVGELVQGLNYSTRLGDELQLTALGITRIAKSHALSSENASELATATDIICKLQEAFFNTNSTQVNVQNNYGYTEFLSDAPAA